MKWPNCTFSIVPSQETPSDIYALFLIIKTFDIISAPNLLELESALFYKKYDSWNNIS